MHARAGALMFPSSCLDGGITRVGPGRYQQYTRALYGGEAVDSSKPHEPNSTRMVAEPVVATDPRAVSPRFSHQQSGGQSSRATCCPFPFPRCGRSRRSSKTHKSSSSWRRLSTCSSRCNAECRRNPGHRKGPCRSWSSWTGTVPSSTRSPPSP